MNLLIDIGNSRVKWAQQKDGILQSCGASCYKKGDPHEFFDPDFENMPKPDRVFVSNVAGEKITRELSAYLDNKWSILPTYLEVRGEAAGVTFAYDDITQLGIDRWLAMIAAWNYYRTAVCIVDCGTALTADVVTASGHHQGGYIVPGLNLMAEVLNSRTEQINYMSDCNASLKPGRNTSECISNGALAAVVALIDTVFDEVIREHGSDSHCVITGGYAEDIRRSLTVDVDYDAHLVLNGIATLTGNP